MHRGLLIIKQPQARRQRTLPSSPFRSPALLTSTQGNPAATTSASCKGTDTLRAQLPRLVPGFSCFTTPRRAGPAEHWVAGGPTRCWGEGWARLRERREEADVGDEGHAREVLAQHLLRTRVALALQDDLVPRLRRNACCFRPLAVRRLSCTTMATEWTCQPTCESTLAQRARARLSRRGIGALK
jgi:hypothetical protein